MLSAANGRRHHTGADGGGEPDRQAAGGAVQVAGP